jgi:uncharacterized membrane protein
MRALGIVGGVCYPLLVYLGLNVLEPRALAAAIGAILVARAGFRWKRASLSHLVRLLPLAVLVGAVLVAAAVFNNGRFFLFVPALVNAALLVAFGRTLLGGPSMIETLARLQGYDISGEKVPYCRTVTVIWCGFFTLNAGVIVWLALYASLAQWTLYTGLLAYLLVGGLMGAELFYRAWRFRDYEHAAVAGLLRRIFPPPEAR